MTNEELKEAIFMALGAASMCWDPLPSNQVFESTRAKDIGDKLVEKLLPILSQCEAMRWEIIALHRVNTALCGDNQTREMADRALEKYREEARSHLGEGV